MSEHKALSASSRAPAHWAFCGSDGRRLIIVSGISVEKARACYCCLDRDLLSHIATDGEKEEEYSKGLIPHSGSIIFSPVALQVTLDFLSFFLVCVRER